MLARGPQDRRVDQQVVVEEVSLCLRVGENAPHFTRDMNQHTAADGAQPRFARPIGHGDLNSVREAVRIVVNPRLPDDGQPPIHEPAMSRPPRCGMSEKSTFRCSNDLLQFIVPEFDRGTALNKIHHDEESSFAVTLESPPLPLREGAILDSYPHSRLQPVSGVSGCPQPNELM